MKTITLREATDKQIVDFIYDNPKDWEQNVSLDHTTTNTRLFVVRKSLK